LIHVEIDVLFPADTMYNRGMLSVEIDISLNPRHNR